MQLSAATRASLSLAESVVPRSARVERQLARLILNNQGVTTSAIAQTLKIGQSLPAAIDDANRLLYQAGLSITTQTPDGFISSRKQRARWFLVELPHYAAMRQCEAA